MLTESEENYLKEMIKKEKLRIEKHNLSFAVEGKQMNDPTIQENLVKQDLDRSQIKEQIIKMKESEVEI